MGTVHAKEATMPQNLRNSRNEGVSNKGGNSTNVNQPSSSLNNDENLHKEHRPDKLLAVKARVDKIHVDGLKRTKDDIIKSQVKELFKAKDFQDVLVRTQIVRGKLESLGCFSSIGVYIDTSEGPDATPEGVEVTFNVREMRRLKGGINTAVGTNDGSIAIQAIAPNVFGRGEKIQMDYSWGAPADSWGSRNKTNINISAVKPFVDSWLHTVLTGSLFSTSSDFPWSGYSQHDKGLLVDLSFNPQGTGTLKHNLQYEAAYRRVVPAKLVSFYVREHSGPNLKSALRHICTIDKRDSEIFPTMGSFIQFSTEVAGLGGDIGFVKNELALQANWTPIDFLTLQLGLQSGLLRSISNDKKISIVDEFFLGGPLNVRGFDMRGCGPRVEGNAIGGDAYWALALHAYMPLPFKPGFGDLFRLHGFVNGGNVSGFTFKFANNYEENLKIFTENVRCTAGGGLVMKIGDVARIELNFIMPLLFARSDVLKQFQFGIGVRYL